MRINLLFSMLSLLLTANTQAASFPCDQAKMKIESIICENAELSNLDDELARDYSRALEKGESIKKEQLRWLKERNKCGELESDPYDSIRCLRYQYRKRSVELQQVRTSEEKHNKTNPEEPKGEYLLSRVADNTIKVCQDFTRNLNQFRQLDFGECNPRLSSKYPQFSRPKWEEIPFDLAIARKVIRKEAVGIPFSTTLSPREQEVFEQRWQEWLQWTEPLRKEGLVKLWRTVIDFDGDGVKETIIRMNPGLTKANERWYPKLPYGCDYYQGAVVMLEGNNVNPAVVEEFRRASETDIIYDFASDRYYFLAWNPNGPARGVILPVGPGKDIGATSGVAMRHMDSLFNDTEKHVSTDCLIDWVSLSKKK